MINLTKEELNYIVGAVIKELDKRSCLQEERDAKIHEEALEAAFGNYWGD
jgi:hypothetical protein